MISKLPPTPERGDALRVVQRVARLVASRMNAAAFGRGVLDALLPAIGADGGTIYLLGGLLGARGDVAGGDELVLVAAMGHEANLEAPPPTLPLVGDRVDLLMLPAPRQVSRGEASTLLLAAGCERYGLEVAAAAPLHAEGARAGLLYAWRRHGERFDDDAMLLLDCVAAQAGTALVAARRAEASERAGEPERLQLSVLQRLASAVGASLDLDTVLSTCLALVDELAAPDVCAIYLVDEATGTMRRAALRGTHDAGALFPTLGVEAVERIRAGIGDPSPSIIDAEQAHEAFRAELRAAGVAMTMTLSLVTNGALVGAVALGFHTRRAFSTSELHTLTAVAEQEAAAIDRARLHALAGLRARLAGALRRVAEQALAASSDQETWDAVLDGTTEIARCPTARLSLIDEEGALVTMAGRTMSAPLAAITRVPFDDPWVRWLAAQTEPAVVADASELPAGSVFRVAFVEAKLCSLAILPLRHRGRLLGYVSSQSSEPRVFHPEELSALRLLGSVAASALESNRLRNEAAAERYRLGQIIEHLPILVAVIDPNLRVTEVNAAFRALNPAVRRGSYYETAVEALGLMQLDGAAFGAGNRTVPRALRGEQVPTLELRLRGPNGLRTILSHAAPLRDAKGVVTGVVLAAQDITVMRELADTKDRFIHIASHELRSPLAALQACTQLLTIDPAAVEDPERRRTLTTRIAFQVDRLVRLVDELLDMARLQGGGLALVPRAMDLAEVARETAEVAQLQSQMHHVAVEARAPVEGRWDRSRMAQVVTNLVSNAMRYSPDGGDVVIAVRVDGAQAVLSVRDHGIGIPPAQQRRLFEPYFRTQEAGEVARGGLGLGLYITHEIVRHHGGRIEVESELGRGSRFTVLLPLHGPN